MEDRYHIRGTMTFGEYLECHQILAAKRRTWVRGFVTLYGIGMLFYGTLFAPSKPDFSLAALGALMVAYGIVISPVQFRYRVKRNWDCYPKIRKEFDVTVSAEGVVTMDDKGAPSYSGWDTFVHFRESRSLFLLYLSPLLPACLPKRLIPPADLPGLRNLLSSAIGPQASSGQRGDANSAALQSPI